MAIFDFSQAKLSSNPAGSGLATYVVGDTGVRFCFVVDARKALRFWQDHDPDHKLRNWLGGPTPAMHLDMSVFIKAY